MMTATQISAIVAASAPARAYDAAQSATKVPISRNEAFSPANLLLVGSDGFSHSVAGGSCESVVSCFIVRFFTSQQYASFYEPSPQGVHGVVVTVNQGGTRNPEETGQLCPIHAPVMATYQHRPLLNTEPPD